MTGPSQKTLERQALASDPASSAWVSANAGSGKTYVLVQRVVRLLLAGADPSRILCLTFTKAAAANMQNRIVARLRGWATAPDETLAAEIAAIESARPSARTLANARKLFARALETPGGLKIYTIHAFCGRLLHQFPFEANVPAGFSELDDRNQAELMAEARAATLHEAARHPDRPIGRALARLVARFAEGTIDEILAEAVAKRDAIARVFVEGGLDGPDGAARELRALFDLSPEDDAEALEARVLDDGLPASEWRSIAAALSEGSANDAKLAEGFLRAAAAEAEAAKERREHYVSVFFTGTGQPRSARAFVTAATRKREPSLAAMLDAELARLTVLVTRLRAARIVERTHALLTLADAAIGAYSAQKSSGR